MPENAPGCPQEPQGATNAGLVEYHPPKALNASSLRLSLVGLSIAVCDLEQALATGDEAGHVLADVGRLEAACTHAVRRAVVYASALEALRP